MMLRRAIFPGSFDPLTNGHLDIIKRSSPLFDEIVIAVLNNPEKNPMFSVEERCAMIGEILPEIETGECNLVVDSFSGLTADFAKKQSATAIVRGIRAISDYEYELQMAAEQYSFVSSKLVKQVFALGGAVGGLIPEIVEAKLKEKLNR